MSSLLRSYKFLKYFSSFGKSVQLPKKTFEVVPVQTCGFLNFYYRDYANAAVRPESKNNSIDKWIRRFDQDVRRTGRVSFRELQEVLDEIKLSGRTTSSQSLMVIRCCGNLIPEEMPEAKIKLVNEIWETLEKQGVLMDISHYNTLLTVYLENEHKFSPTNFLDTLDKKGVEPNRVTFQRLIAAFCQQGNIDGATRILEFMKEKQMPISENIFNSLIIGHSQVNDMESAKGMLGVMQQANIEPSSETYTALLSGYAKNGDMNGISDVFNLALSKEVTLHDRQLLDVIYSLAVNDYTKLIDVILPRLSRQSGYNQDCKNTILRLVARGKDEAGIKLLRSMTPINSSEDEPLFSGTFLIRQMIKLNKPFEKVLALCEDLKNSKDNERALFYATESCLIHKNTEMGLKLISAISEIEPVCQHYYWPILSHYGKTGNHDGIIRTLKQMSLNLNQPIPNETLREHVVEYLGPSEKGIMALRQAGITVASSASAVVAYNLISNQNLATAARIASKYRANYNLISIRRGIVQSFKINADIDNMIQLVRAIVSNLNVVENNREEGEEAKEGPDPAGTILLGICSNLRSDRAAVITRILQGYLEYGLGITQGTAELLQEKLSGGELTPEISNLLSKLVSPDLTLVDLQRATPVRPVSLEKDEASLLEAINQAEAKEEKTDSFKFQLMSLYCKHQKYDNVDKLRQELADKGVVIPSDYLVTLMNSCINNENITEAEKYYKEIIASSPNFEFNDSTIIKLASRFIAADKFDDAVSLFERHRRESYAEKEFSYTSTCWKLLNAVTETGDASKVDKLFNTMKSCNFIMPSNVLLGPLIKVHIIKNDIKSALDKFEECCTLYRSTPWKNELACKLIQAEDAASLQRLTDLSTQIHGEVNSLYDLVLSFIECGRIRQARKILETPGLRTRHSRLSTACLRYQNEGRVAHLESLVEVTKDLPHIDRSDIYYHLLGSYCNSDEVDKAQGLWTQMQEEDVQPSDRFLIRLAGLLKKHNRPVPFSVPSSATTDRLNNIQKITQESGELKSLRRYIYAKDLDKALEIKQNIPDTELQSFDRSSLLTLLINNGRLGESIKLLTRWLEVGLRPNVKSLNYLINTVAKTGDTNSLTIIGNMLDEDLKKLTSFSNRYTHCMVEAGKADEVLKILESEIDNADTEKKVEHCRNAFPRGGVFSLLNFPENIPKFEKLAQKYKEKGILEPLNILWIHYFISKDTEKADTLWQSIKGLQRLMYQPILKKATADRDLPLVETLLHCCQHTNISPNALGIVHSCILDILIMLDRVDECSARLDELLKTMPIDVISFGTLRRIKSTFESQGRLFKYNIPPKQRRRGFQNSSSSSDSESDDEVKQKS